MDTRCFASGDRGGHPCDAGNFLNPAHTAAHIQSGPASTFITCGGRGQGRVIQPDPSCIMYYTYYIILCINTGRIISGHNTARWRGGAAAAEAAGRRPRLWRGCRAPSHALCTGYTSVGLNLYCARRRCRRHQPPPPPPLRRRSLRRRRRRCLEGRIVDH